MRFYRPFLALALLSPIVWPAPARADDVAAEALKFARSKYGAGAYGEAADAARAVLEDDPAHGDALEILAAALMSTGEELAAERELRAVLARAPSATAALLLLGENLAVRGLLGDAVPLLERSRAAARRPFRAGAALAAALLEMDRRDEAAKVLRELFAAYTEADEGELDAGDLRALARAALVAERVPALAREHARPFAKDARNFFQKSFERDRAQVDLIVEWAHVYADKWDLVEARRLVKEALKRNARHAAAHALVAEIELMDLFGGTEKYDKARSAIQNALAVNPRFAPAHVLEAELLITDALYDDALASLAKALEARPNDGRALAGKAGVLRLRGDATAAAAVESAALGRGRAAAAEFCWRFAALLDSKFQYLEALTYAKKAVESDPECWPAYGQLGLAAMRTGDEATARTYLEKAHEADPFDLFTYNQLKLLDYLEREFETITTANFVIRLHKSEVTALKPYVTTLVDRSWRELSMRYGVKLPGPILLEVFPNLSDFSVRAVAHRFIPASGVTFARVVALASPAAFPPGTHGWGRVLWHELAHVATLERSGYRVPRWLTEGIAVFEESKGHSAWIREWDVPLVDALDRGRLLPILELNQGFSKPKFPNQVLLSYYQGGLICQFVEQTWGFEALLKLLDGYREGLDVPANMARALGGIDPVRFDRAFLEFARKALGPVPYRAQCDDPTVLARLRREAKDRPQDAKAQARYALASVDMKRYADAEAAAGRLRKLDPLSGDALLVEALIARHRKAFDDVPRLAAEARAAETSDPILAEVLQAEYYTHKPAESKQRRNLAKAIAAYEAAHQLFPRHPYYVGRLIELYKEAGEPGKRFAKLRLLAELEPNNLEARAELAEEARDAGDFKSAARWLEEILWLEPRPPKLHQRLAEARLRLGDLAGARFEVDLSLTLDPTDSEARVVAEALKTAEQAKPNGEQPLAPSGTAAPEGAR